MQQGIDVFDYSLDSIFMEDSTMAQIESSVVGKEIVSITRLYDDRDSQDNEMNEVALVLSDGSILRFIGDAAPGDKLEGSYVTAQAAQASGVPLVIS